MDKNTTTEEKIKKAANKIFQQKGFGAARTRDIAEEAGINLALLNYYFRSKQKLYEIIMEESIREMFSFLLAHISVENTTLSQKLDLIVNRYLDILTDNPNLPLFVINEMQKGAGQLFEKIEIDKDFLANSYFMKQMEQQIQRQGVEVKPFHIFINMVSLSLFPLLAKPILLYAHRMDDEQYADFIKERRVLIPIWLKSMLKLEN